MADSIRMPILSTIRDLVDQAIAEPTPDVQLQEMEIKLKAAQDTVAMYQERIKEQDATIAALSSQNSSLRADSKQQTLRADSDKQSAPALSQDAEALSQIHDEIRRLKGEGKALPELTAVEVRIDEISQAGSNDAKRAAAVKAGQAMQDFWGAGGDISTLQGLINDFILRYESGGATTGNTDVVGDLTGNVGGGGLASPPLWDPNDPGKIR